MHKIAKADKMAWSKIAAKPCLADSFISETALLLEQRLVTIRPVKREVRTGRDQNCMEGEVLKFVPNIPLDDALRFTVDVKEPTVRRVVMLALLLDSLSDNGQRQLVKKAAMLVHSSLPSLKERLKNQPGGVRADQHKLDELCEQLRELKV